MTTATSNVAAFYDSSANSIVISPVGFGEVGVHTIDLVLWDYSLGTSGRTPVSMSVTVTNSAPFFTVATMPSVKAQMNRVTNYVVT